MRVATILALAVSAVLTACGGSPTAPQSAGQGQQQSAGAGGQAGQGGQGGQGGQVREHAKAVYDRLNGLTGEQRRTELVKLAEEEGELSIYTSNTDIDKLVEAFEDKYDIDVSVYRGNSESVLQRVLQEQKANYFGNDVFETNALELNVANKEGFLYPYKSELRDAVRKEAQAENWTGSRFNIFVVGWNTKLVPAGQEPKSLQELAEPKWKGKVSMEVGDVDWFTAMVKSLAPQLGGEQQAVDLMKRIAAGAKIVKGHTVQGELLSAGQFPIAISAYSHTIDKAAAKGAPVAWRPASGKPVQPLVVRPNGIGMMTTAAHPAAATLFVDFELEQDDGQKIFASVDRVGATAAASKVLSGLEVVPVPEQELLENAKKWDDLYAEVVQAGEEVGG